MRAFNRFYTQTIGLTGRAYLESPFSLTQVRILYELAHRPDLTATDLARDLDLDPGYLSRLLQQFTEKKLVRKTRSPDDARRTTLALTAAGTRAFAPLDERSRQAMQALLKPLDVPNRARLLGALRTVQTILQPATRKAQTVLIRPHRPGDIGWVIAAHGRLYAQEYGWDSSFEALVAQIAGDFLRQFDPARECCWIAEQDGVNIGSAFVVQRRDETSGAVIPGVAQLRMVILEPAARGVGLGKRLVDECIRFARSCGYANMMLWTNDCLHAARAIYEGAGFVLVSEEKHRSFGHDLIGQHWRMDL